MGDPTAAGTATMVVIIVGVLAGTLFLLGLLVASELRKTVLRGRAGTRADTQRARRRRRAGALRRRYAQVHGPGLRLVPAPHPERGPDPPGPGSVIRP